LDAKLDVSARLADPDAASHSVPLIRHPIGIQFPSKRDLSTGTRFKGGSRNRL
jgi:hypothetical protein